MADTIDPFVFHTERRLVVLTGRKACNLENLLCNIKQVSGSCIFYHMHYLYLSHHFEKPRFYNDFANWVSHALQDERLAEKLAAIDLLTFTHIRDVREAIIGTIQKHIEATRGYKRECPEGEQFYFCEAKSFIMPTGQVAHSLPEFFSTVEHLTNSCLHFHFFEARLRLERPTNDFSQWMRNMGQKRMAERIDHLNPYAMTLDELKHEIARLGRKYRSKPYAHSAARL